MAPASKCRQFRWSLRTMFVVVTAICCWLGWMGFRVSQRNSYIKYLEGQPFGSGPAWSLRHDPAKLPWTWRVMGATQPTWVQHLFQNPALTDPELKRAMWRLPDFEFQVCERDGIFQDVPR
jgi:hypothetical protein